MSKRTKQIVWVAVALVLAYAAWGLLMPHSVTTQQADTGPVPDGDLTAFLDGDE